MYDLALIHAPAFPNFRFRNIDFGPISDVIPSYPIFDTFPLGLVSLQVYLEKRGFKVKIINLAARALLSRKFDMSKALEKIKARVYGVSLHWLVHLNGALWVAKKIKEIHEAPILLGGLSSTVFWKDLIKLPFIDYIIRGDTTEEPVRILLELLDNDVEELSRVPNLVWKKDKKIIENNFNYVPNELDPIDHSVFVRCATRDGWLDSLPFANFIQAPITAVFTVKGCAMNCAACGGSAYAFKKYFNRNRLAIKKPEKIVEEVLSISERIKASIFFVGDLQQTGMAKEILRAIREERIDSPLIFEFFRPPGKELLEEYRKASDDVYLQISPETHDTELRLLYGRPYTTSQLLRFLRNAVTLNFNRLDVYFMIGIPHQDISSAINTAKFAGKLLIPGKIDAFIAPLAPFIDPGSLAYDYPSRYGYRILYRRLADYSKALNKDLWVEMMNYESLEMHREEIALATYIATRILLEEKVRKGIISEEQGKELIEKILSRERNLVKKSFRKKTEYKVEKITCHIKELYPSRAFFLSLKPRILIDGAIGYLHRFLRFRHI